MEPLFAIGAWAPGSKPSGSSQTARQDGIHKERSSSHEGA